MINLIDDVSKVTTVSVNSLKDIVNTAEMCVSHAVLESKLNCEPITEIDCTLGKLYIKLGEGEIAYKFIPSKHLEKAIVRTLQTNESDLTKAVENSLTQRVLTAYKDLL